MLPIAQLQRAGAGLRRLLWLHRVPIHVWREARGACVLGFAPMVYLVFTCCSPDRGNASQQQQQQPWFARWFTQPLTDWQWHTHLDREERAAGLRPWRRIRRFGDEGPLEEVERLLHVRKAVLMLQRVWHELTRPFWARPSFLIFLILAPLVFELISRRCFGVKARHACVKAIALCERVLASPFEDFRGLGHGARTESAKGPRVRARLRRAPY